MQFVSQSKQISSAEIQKIEEHKYKHRSRSKQSCGAVKTEIFSRNTKKIRTQIQTQIKEKIVARSKQRSSAEIQIVEEHK